MTFFFNLKAQLLLVVFLTNGYFSYSQGSVNLYVSPDGSDGNKGTIDAPFQSIRKAQSIVRKIESGVITIYLRGGTYRLESPLHFSPEDSGSKAKKIIYRSFGDEVPILKGSQKLNLKWKNAGKGLVKASIEKNISFERLFINGQKQILARYPNFQKEVTPYNGWAADAIAPERIAQWKMPKGGYLHALHRAQWGGYHWRITGVDENGEAVLEGGWQNNRPEQGVHQTFRFVENIKEELDTINEWYLDQKESTLYWMPNRDDDLNNLVVEVPQLRHLLEITGTETTPIENLHFKGIHFQHTTRTFMDSKDRLLRSDWAIYRGGAILVRGAKNISIRYCHLEDLGGNAIFFDGYVRNSTVASNRITRIGASGISFVGNTSAVRSPNYAYRQYTPYTELDTIVGPKNNLYPADNLVYDNLIFELGQIEKQTAGIQIAMAMDITVRHNSIYHAPRAGINIGDGNWGGHIIEYNDVFDTVRETSDHGSFNSWGRDRYWNASRDRVNEYVAKYPDLPLLDAMKTVHIRNNRFRCDHGWDIVLDDGSTNYQIYNNLSLANGIKVREGFYRKVYNNITVNNSIHVHVWYENSMDYITNNILGTWYWPIRMPEIWGQLVDYNLFDMSEKPFRLIEGGRDAHSILSDPQFINPSKGDYQVSPTSPALSMGFHNFDMHRFGVVSEHLKKEAKTPVLPDYSPGLQAGQEPSRNNSILEWLGGKIKNLVGMGEVSATGMFAEIGVLFIEVPEDSKLAKLGFKKGDVLFEFWGNEVENIEILTIFYNSKPKGRNIPVTVFRNQERLQLHVN